MKKTQIKKVKKSENKMVNKTAGKTEKKTQKIQPLGSRVLIRPYTREELVGKNSFGIILPESGSKEKSEQGEVLAVGPGEYQDGKRVAVQVKVGDKVVFSKYGYEDVTVDGEELFLIKDENILAILK